MFSTSMAPPRPTYQEEELFTTVAPTIKEEHEHTDDGTDFDFDDFERKNLTSEFFTPRGDTFREPQVTTESTSATESVSKPMDGPDDHSVIEINTIQPDVPIPDASLITEPMFAEGKTEETVLGSVITTAMTSDLTSPESTELTSEEVFVSSESTPSTGGLHSTTSFPDYNHDIDDIETEFAVEAVPPTPPSQQDLSSSPPESTSIDGTTASPTDTTFMSNTQPSSEVEITTTAPAESTSTATQTRHQTQEETTSAARTATTVLIDSGTSAEDVMSSASVHVFDESTTQMPEHSGDTLTENNTSAEIGTEFLTFVPVASAVDDTTTAPVTVVADEHSTQVTTGKTYKQYLKPRKQSLKGFMG